MKKIGKSHCCHAGSNVKNVWPWGVIKSRYSQCFKGVGKLKCSSFKLHVDPQCEPVAQPVRRVPFGYKYKVTQLPHGLVAEDIIEPERGLVPGG